MGSRELFMERFPKLALLFREENRDPKESIGAVALEEVEILYIYGLGKGGSYPSLKEWLHQDPCRKLIFLDETPALTGKWAEPLLQDPQVFFATPEDLEECTAKWPASHIEVLSLPSKKGPRFRAIREALFRKTAFSHALYLDRMSGYQILENFLENLQHLPHSFYANGLKNSFQNVPAIICGAGPSLQAAIPHLKTFENKALVIGGGSTIAALSSHGILPHFGMAFDPNLEEYRRFRHSFAFEMPLLYSTRLFPKVFQTLSGPFGYLRSGIGGILELWLEEELKLSGALVGDTLSQDALSVTTMCIAWAEFLGCNPILFSGLDLAYTEGKRYAKGVGNDDETPNQPQGALDTLVKKKGRDGTPIVTAVRWLMEARAIGDFARKHRKTQFYNTTEKGLPIRGVPYQSLEVFSFEEREGLRERVYGEIAKSKMPSDTGKVIEEKVGELGRSLERIIECLEILAGKKRGSSALAEYELREEMAYPYLFYDTESLLKIREEGPIWEQFLTHAKKYEAILNYAHKAL